MSLAGALKSRFLRESSTLQGAALVNATSNLVGSVALTHVLGARELGVLYLAVGAYSLLWSLLNLGLASVTTSRVAASGRGGGDARAGGWIGVFARISVVLALLALALGQLVLPPAARAAYADVGVRVGGLAALLALTPLLDGPRIVLSSGLQGTRRMGALAGVDTGQELARLFLVVTGAVVTGSALGPVLGMLGASLVGSALAGDAYRRARRDGAPLPPVLAAWRDRSVPVREALGQGVQVGLVRNVDALGVQILPTLILGYFGDPRWVAYLRIAQRMVAVARLLMQGIHRTALPALSQLAGVRDAAGLRRVYWRASLLSGVTISTGILLVLPLLPFAIRALFPPDFHGPVWTIVLILAPGVMVVSFSVANDVFYLVTGQLRVAIALSFLGLFVNTAQVALLAWWMPTVGVAWGLTVTCLWSLVHLVYAALWFRRRTTGEPARQDPENVSEGAVGT